MKNQKLSPLPPLAPPFSSSPFFLSSSSLHSHPLVLPLISPPSVLSPLPLSGGAHFFSFFLSPPSSFSLPFHSLFFAHILSPSFFSSTCFFFYFFLYLLPLHTSFSSYSFAPKPLAVSHQSVSSFPLALLFQWSTLYFLLLSVSVHESCNCIWTSLPSWAPPGGALSLTTPRVSAGNEVFYASTLPDGRLHGQIDGAVKLCWGFFWRAAKLLI